MFVQIAIILIENYLFGLVKNNLITEETAMEAAFRPEMMARLLGLPFAGE